jgi:hypothetical protein
VSRIGGERATEKVGQFMRTLSIVTSVLGIFVNGRGKWAGLISLRVLLASLGEAIFRSGYVTCVGSFVLALGWGRGRGLEEEG